MDKEICKCPADLQKICKKTARSSKGGLDDIIAAMEIEDYYQKAKKRRPFKYKMKKYKPLPIKEKRIPMYPPMHMRLKYLHHCDPEPFAHKRVKKKPRIRYTDNFESDEDIAAKQEREAEELRRIKDMQKCKITVPGGPKFVKHTDSDISIIHVPSPKLSGHVISAQPAPVRATELRPPLPAKSGFELYKPHSGIVINQDKEWAPEGAISGAGTIAKRPKKKKLPPCAKGRVCRRTKCKNKKCRKYAAMRRRQMARAARSGKYNAVAASGHSGGRPCRALAGRKAKYARDGKPRAKHYPSGRMPRDDTGCGLDDIERPEYPEIPKGLKRGAFRTHSLTVVPCTKDGKSSIHFGILKGSHNLYDEKFGKSRGRQALPMSIMAYCLAYHYHPKQWNTKLIDALMEAGDQWYVQSLEKLHDHSAYQGMCEVIPFGKQRVVILNKKKMQVLLCEPEIVGYAMSTDPTVYNLCRGLKAFFSSPDTRACVIMTRVLKIAVWRDKVCYYIFDPAGRDAKCYSNFANGTAALMNVLSLEDVIDILLPRSIIEDQKYVLAPIKVLAMVSQSAEDDLESEPEPNSVEKAKMSYRILSQNLAVVNANMHLGDPSFEDTKFQQALTIAVTALTYSKISPPNTWYKKTLDKILRLGNKLYKDCKNPKIAFEMNIDNIPNEIIMGPYTCEIIIYRDRTKGQLFTTKECILNIRTGLDDFFSHEYNGGILDFNNYKLAVWRQKDMFYMFDPYPRTDNGERALKNGKACCFMLLNTDAMAEAFSKNWDFLPATTQFNIHAFKVLKLAQRTRKNQLTVSLSATRRMRSRSRSRLIRQVLPPGAAHSPTRADGDKQVFDLTSATKFDDKDKGEVDEEYMGEIISLVDSIQEDFIPPVPMKYKNMEPEPEPFKVHNLDSPTVSVTQVIPPWPKPRDKTNEPPEPDPDPEPTPPPTPPPPIPPEGAEEEEEEEEELDEEEQKRRKEEERRRKLEEEEARRKAEELPPPMPPPPPTPQIDEEVKPLPSGGRRGGSVRGGGLFSASLGASGVESVGGDQGAKGGGGAEGGAGTVDFAAEDGREVAMQDDDISMEPVQVERYVLLTEDAKRRYKMRQKRKQMSLPLEEPVDEPPVIGKDGRPIITKPHNFEDLPDMSQIIRASAAVPEKNAVEELPFVSIMAVVTSYKYAIDTWTRGIVDFVVTTSKQLYQKKLKDFQACPLHVIPKIAIGHQAYQANIDVVGEGATWQLEYVLEHKFFPKYDRGILTTPFYSCAFFKKNGMYYLFDGSECNPMGIRYIHDSDDKKEKKHPPGKACFTRFTCVRDLANRIQFNKAGTSEEAQFILSRIIVRRLLAPPRRRLPEDYNYELMKPKSKKSKLTVIEDKKEPEQVPDEDMPVLRGYKDYDGIQRLMGTTAMGEDKRKEGDVKPEHFVCLVAMLMATMRPVRDWDSQMVDACLETGNEIADKAVSLAVCEKRVIKNVIVCGKYMDLNLKKIIVINDNPDRFLEQYMKAVLARLRYVLIRFPGCNLVVVQSNGVYHLFDPCVPPKDEPPESTLIPKVHEPTKRVKSDYELEAEYKQKAKDLEKEQEIQRKKEKEKKKKGKSPEVPKAASWTMYRTLDGLINRVKLSFLSRKFVINKDMNNPEFYTFELTSVRPAPRHAMYNYKLSPLFRPDENPNLRYMRPRKPRALVDEKMYWLNVDAVPWSRANLTNDAGVARGAPGARWKAWDIEFPGDLYSLWGSLHPRDARFPAERRGAQYLAGCVIACVMARVAGLAAWTPSFLDGIVLAADELHGKVVDKLRAARNHEVKPEDYQGVAGELYPYKFTIKVENVIFGFVYNLLPDRFNLSRALSYFFEKHDLGILVSPSKNLAFGKIKYSYFMFDCQTYGAPVHSRSAYILKCESLNRLIYCMTLTLNLRVHNQQFNLYSLHVDLSDAPPKKPPLVEDKTPVSSKPSDTSKSSNVSDKSQKSGTS